MPRITPLRFIRSLRAALNSTASGGGLLAGEPYLITDENRLAVGLSTTTYEAMAKQSEVRTFASAADYRAKTASRAYGSEVWDALAVVTLTDGATITVDMNAGIDFAVTLAGNRTLGAPSNPRVGQRGRIRIAQDATGNRTLSLNAAWKTAGGTGIVLSTAANAIDYLDYDVVSATHIRVALSKAWPA
jgi:hypothetical protein